MPDRTHYSRAPIIEATIDLRTEQGSDLTVDDLAALGEKLAQEYPEQGSEHLYSGRIQADETGYPQLDSSHQHVGYTYVSKGSQRILSAKLDGFSFSIHAPYDRWETFRDEARRLWDLYKSVSVPESVTRIALRYINRIDVPNADNVNLGDYLRVYPAVSQDWPGQGNMQSFFMQIQLWQDDLGCWTVINETPETPPDEETGSIRLDFDIFREEFESPWDTDDDSGIWQFLEQLHERKNAFFEASITDQTRRLIG